MIHFILEQKYFDNTLLDYLISVGIIIVLVLTIRVLKGIIQKRLKAWIENTKIIIDDVIISGIEKFIIPLLYFCAFYFGLTYLNLSTSVAKIFHSALVIIVAFFIIRFTAVVTHYVFKYYWEKRVGDKESMRNLRGISTIVTIVVWGLGLLFLLDNLDFRISAIITGLGIGGVAVAFAAQAVLSDFFGYFVIFFDRPFQVGDFIIVDDKMGIVENIGVKTTRITSVAGEQIVFPNSRLTSSRIHNYKQMERRRVLFTVGVTYQTPLQKLKEMPGIIKNIIENIDDAVFGRAHFQSYENSSMIFEIVYYIIGSDFNKYMDIQQRINFRIYEEFEARGIERPTLLKLHS